MSEKAMAAIYLQSNNSVKNKLDGNFVSSVKNNIKNAISDAKLELTNFSPAEFAKNFALSTPVGFVQDYVVQTLSDIILGEKISDEKMLDLFFNKYAPVLNMKCLQMGYSGLAEMKTAIKNRSGLNMQSFVQGLSDGLEAVRNENKLNNIYKNYGEEIPIDVVKKCDFSFSGESFIHNISLEDISKLHPNDNTNRVLIKFEGNVNNESGDLVKSNTIIQKLARVLSSKSLVALRVGKDVFENCLIAQLNPSVVNAYNLKLDIEFSCYYYEGYTTNSLGGRSFVLNRLSADL